jgi:hypothetical protein
MKCADVECRHPREGGRFCPDHQAEMDRIRQEFEASEKRRGWKNLADKMRGQ